MQDRPDAQPEPQKDAEQSTPETEAAQEAAAETAPQTAETAEAPQGDASAAEAPVEAAAEAATPAEPEAAAPEAASPEAAAPETPTAEAAAEPAEAGAEKSEEFAAMLAAEEAKKAAGKAGAEKGGQADLKVGDKVSGVLAKIGPETSFVDFGGRSEGALKTLEIQGEDGKALFDEGDPIEAFVTAVGEGVELTRSLGKNDRQTDLLYQAFKSGIPIEGKVTAVNQWGLGVEVQGVRAFCPVSQIDTKFVESTDEYREQTMEFKIIRFRDQGRNIVVSRKALLQADQEKEADNVREQLRAGVRLHGKVTRLEDFGAFVDLGAGVEGLVHVSELRHERVGHPKEVLQPEQEIEVAVLGVKSLGSKRKERISLSIKALEKDPWAEALKGLKRGAIIEAKIESLEDYGAFAEVAENVRGMIHVSEIADHRVNHPRDVLSVGQEVKVVVVEVDNRRKRLRLSIRQVETMESTRNLKEFKERQEKERDESSQSNSLIDALRRAQLID